MGEGLEAVVDSVHAQQGDVDVVLHPQTPDSAFRHFLRAHKQLVIPEEFMVVRNDAVSIRKVGEYSRT